MPFNNEAWNYGAIFLLHSPGLFFFSLQEGLCRDLWNELVFRLMKQDSENITTGSPKEVPMDYRELVNQAAAARQNSYSPYSKFKVGASLLTVDDRLYTGVNIEHASYGLTVCAERTG
jgi:hypothetical protein